MIMSLILVVILLKVLKAGKAIVVARLLNHNLERFFPLSIHTCRTALATRAHTSNGLAMLSLIILLRRRVARYSRQQRCCSR